MLEIWVILFIICCFLNKIFGNVVKLEFSKIRLEICWVVLFFFVMVIL